MTAHHWWTRAELEVTDEDIWPRDLLAGSGTRSVAGDAVGGAPLRLGDVDESTVAPA